MDQITKHKLDRAADDLIASIDPSKVCELASSFHPDKRPCRVFSKWKKGSYKVCFPIIFSQDESLDGEKWMVRIPLLPRLAFPEEKMRSEIATMKYVKSLLKQYTMLTGTDISWRKPRSLSLIYTDTRSTTTMSLASHSCLRREKREHIYTQLGSVYIQLYQQQFDRIGALTLDDDGHWEFGNNRPLTVDIKEQEIGGLDVCSYLPLSPHQTFVSTIDYVFMLVRLMFNDFYRGRDSIVSEEDARNYLFSLYACQGILMEWVNPEYNGGPFILMHGDLSPPNIVIDDEFNIISILDWEWSSTIPAQLFVPPSWLTNLEAVQFSEALLSLPYYAAAREFMRVVYRLEWKLSRKSMADCPLDKLWSALRHSNAMIIPHGLLKPHDFGSVYWNALDRQYYGYNSNERVETFFNLSIRQSDLQAEVLQAMRGVLGKKDEPTVGKAAESGYYQRRESVNSTAVVLEVRRHGLVPIIPSQPHNASMDLNTALAIFVGSVPTKSSNSIGDTICASSDSSDAWSVPSNLS
ncbi:hypothetical protein AJ78_05927 [Emergomyces pasteurianus Ep9510]|uniref:Uncharacterized protein n=1 Tax=Emergomyces pasteurianus Ep9510 TaxID=1447872 RepID=A0A1J9PC68_9EURO|nr:hypothetical protein AJ78_05927 [Emergomyces pasteurianus Ep9510]